jgi:hypothetical protein
MRRRTAKIRRLVVVATISEVRAPICTLILAPVNE